MRCMKTSLLSEAGRRAGLPALTVIIVMLRYQERYKNAVFNKVLLSIVRFIFV